MSHHTTARPSAQPPAGFLSQDECRSLFARLLTMRTGGGDTNISLVSQWIGSAKWARSRMHVVADAHENSLTVTRTVRTAQAQASTTQIDDAGLREVVETAEFALQYVMEQAEQISDPFIDQPTLRPTLWSDATYAWDATGRTTTAQAMIAPADTAGMEAAGELKVAAQGHAVLNSSGLVQYYPVTAVDCSVTVRDVKSSASGWAGISHYDRAKVDSAAIAARALDKCQRSANPVAVEPGHYTAILEPQAVSDLFTPLIEKMMDRRTAEQGGGPFSNGVDNSKIGERVLDSRLIVRADPMDPDAGFVPFDGNDGTPYRPVNWIDRGVLRELAYDRSYALEKLGTDQALLNSKSYTLMAGADVPTVSIETMIAKTQRGILVTRFSDVRIVESRSMLSSGYTRDGVWLIENGKIAKAIKNFRFTESPLFALNSLEDVGTPVRVFRPGFATKTPAVRVRDFSFTSLADAV